MGKRWSGLLLLLLLLFSFSVYCCQSLEEEHFQDSVEEGLSSSTEEDLSSLEKEDFEDDGDDDDLEDLEDGWEDEEGASRMHSSADVIAATKVANVNDQDVERVIGKYEYVLLLGYAPWCTQSQALVPEFAAAAAELARQGNPALLAKMDATNNPATASRYEIVGFPTILFFVNGSSESYLGSHSREEIVLWVRKKTGDVAATITSKEEAESFLRKNITAVFGYFNKFEGPEYDAFIAAAKAETATEFVQTTVAEVAQIDITRPMFIDAGGSFTTEEISSFVELNKYPLVTLLNSKNANTVYSSPLKFHVLLFSQGDNYEVLKSLYLAAAKEFKGKVMFVVVDPKDEEFSMPMLALYGLDSGKPAVAGLDNADGSRYLMESDFTYGNLKNFVADLYTGNLPVYYKSESIPAQNEGLVKMVVGKSFDEIVMDDTKDVLLHVHAPWCIKCEKVNRVLEKLAGHLEGVPSLVLAKYDASANEHPSLLDVPNFPSLLLYPAGRKSNSPISAEAHTSWKKLLDFLKKNVAIPFTIFKDGKAALNADGRQEAAKMDKFTPELVGTNVDLKEDIEFHPFDSPPFVEKELIEEESIGDGVAQELISASSQSEGSTKDLYREQSQPNDEL